MRAHFSDGFLHTPKSTRDIHEMARQLLEAHPDLRMSFHGGFGASVNISANATIYIFKRRCTRMRRVTNAPFLDLKSDAACVDMTDAGRPAFRVPRVDLKGY